VPAPVADDAAWAGLWAQVMTGLELGPRNDVQVLESRAWLERASRLKEWPDPAAK